MNDVLPIIDLVLLALMVLTALGAALSRRLLKSALGLALLSVELTLLMFRLHSPLAAVFELSVCAGLITVIFISAISLTLPQTPADLEAMRHRRIRKYWPLLVILLLVLIGFARLHPAPIIPAAPVGVSALNVKQVLWTHRPLDLLGQVLVLLAGVFGIVVLFKDSDTDKHE